MVYIAPAFVWIVRSQRGLAPVFTGAILFVLLVAPAMVFAAQTTQGYVAYSVTLTGASGSKSFILNESVQSSSNAGSSNLILNLVGQTQHLTYSRLVNASTNLFPYLPTLGSPSLSYTGKNYSVTLSLTPAGAGTVSFQGTSQSTKEYKLAYSATLRTSSYSGNGTVVTFPSTLIYSLTIKTDTKYEVNAILTATNLPLTDPPSSSPTAALITAGAGVGAAALVISLLIRRRRNSHVDAGTAEKKPLHWAD